MRATAKFATVLALLAIVVGACGDGDPAVAPSPAEDVETPTAEAAASDGTVQVVESDHGEILADGEGRAVYVFLRDEAGQSNCTGGCAETWPPLEAEGAPVAGEGVDEALLGTIDRDDGSTQVTYNDQPLYHYSADTSPGDTNGQGVGDNWYVVSPEGEPVQD